MKIPTDWLFVPDCLGFVLAVLAISNANTARKQGFKLMGQTILFLIPAVLASLLFAFVLTYDL